MIGQMLGHYEITGKIGKGGMGIVYRAVDTLIGRDVALKTILLKEIEDPNERQFLKERLFREAKSAGILSHPNIVTVFQIGEQDGLTYIAMEFVDGPNLAELLNRPERPTIETLVSILDQSAAALDYAHSRGVVHRDIKPGNIIVRTDGVAKIADFGVAKISSQSVTRTGMTLGTPHYMSPEQFHGRTIDGRSDQYSLAVMVYEIFTGKKPFTAESITGLMYKILHEKPNPRRDNPDLSGDTEAVLCKALSKDPDERYPTCTEFISQLRDVSGVKLKHLPFESHSRTPAAGTSAQFSSTPHAAPYHTPQPTPAGARPPEKETPHIPVSTPSSGLPSTGMMPPPPPVPPSQAWNFRSPEAGAALEDTPTPAPPPAASASHPPIPEAPTPGTGAPGSGALSSGVSVGINLPPPPAPQMPLVPAASSGDKRGATPSSKGPPVNAAKGKAAKSASTPNAASAATAAKPKGKTPIFVVAGAVVLLLIAVGIVIYVLGNRSQSAAPPEVSTAPPAESSPQTSVENPTPPVTPPVESTETATPNAEVPAPGAETAPATTTPGTSQAPPAIASFVAEPATITEGESTTLRWNTSQTTLISVEPGLARGRSVGQVTVSPKQTTRYRLVARGLGGRKTQDLTVTVKPSADGPGPNDAPLNPQGMSLDALTRALAAGENVVSMNQLMVRVGLKGVSFPVSAQAQAAILAAGDRGERPKDAVVRLIDLAKQGGRR